MKGTIALMIDTTLILSVDTDDPDEAMRHAKAVADGVGQEGENISALGVVHKDDKGAYVGSSVDGMVAVVFTQEEAQALHNHTEGAVLVVAQDKLREAMGE